MSVYTHTLLAAIVLPVFVSAYYTKKGYLHQHNKREFTSLNLIVFWNHKILAMFESDFH